jgi:hypothetical protein
VAFRPLHALLLASSCALALSTAASAQDRPAFLAPTDEVAGAVELSIDGASVGLVEALVAEDGEPYLPVAVIAGLVRHRVLSESPDLVEGQGPKGRWRIDARRLTADGVAGTLPISAGTIARSATMLFAQSSALATLLGLDIRFDRRAMVVAIVTGEAAPTRLHRTAQLPTERAREYLTLPALEIGADLSTDGTPSIRASAAGYIPAGRLSTSLLASLSSTLTRSITSARLTAEVRDLLPGTLIQAGDTYPYIGSLSAPARGGLGVYLRPDFSTSRSSRIPSGDAPAGWTAEISTPAGIAATVPVDGSGRWTAPDDLALFPGQTMSITLRGPDGEERHETFSVPLGARLRPGEVSYSAAIWLDEGSLLDQVEGRTGSLAGFSELERGFGWGSLRAGVAHRPHDAGSRQELSAGLSTGVGTVGLEADLGAASTGAVAGRIVLSASAGGWSGLIDHRRASDGWAYAGMDPAQVLTRVRTAGRIGDTSLSATFEQRSGSPDAVQIMAGRQIGPLYAQASVEQGRYGQGLRIGQTVSWSTSVDGDPMIVRARHIGRETFMDATWLDVEGGRRFGGIGTAADGRFRAYAGASQDIDGYRLSGQIERQSDGWSLRLGVSTSFGGGALARPAKAGELSRLTVRAWMDFNGNGRRDHTEPAVEDGIPVTANGITDALRAGQVTFPVPAGDIRISLAADSIAGGMVAAERPQRLITVRPGSSVVVDIPVVPAGVIMGRVEGPGRIAGRRVTGRGPGGRTLTTITDPGGEYLLDHAVLGAWTVEVEGLPSHRIVLTSADPMPDIRHRLPMAENVE